MGTSGETKLCYEWHSEKYANDLHVITDNDWAGCLSTQRSTSGGVMRLGAHTLKTWALTQPTVALSSVELLAMVDGATRGLGMQIGTPDDAARSQTPKLL